MGRADFIGRRATWRVGRRIALRVRRTRVLTPASVRQPGHGDIQMHRIAVVRAPFTYRYNGIDVREDTIVSQLCAFLRTAGHSPHVFDFHLERGTTAHQILSCDPTTIVIVVRETGDNVFYALRLARFLHASSRAQIVLYGQTARLVGHSLLPDAVKILPHSELELGKLLGLAGHAAQFSNGNWRQEPYFDQLKLEPWQEARFRGTLETTRGCPFPCSFCFINSGANHDKRWQRQSAEATLDELASYTAKGINAFVFHDSEFIGGSRGDIGKCQELVEAIVLQRPDILFKIYARADTILKYPDIGRLKEAGLVSVFMGVESFVQSDLDDLRKALSVEKIHAAIGMLSAHDIYMDLSFILFNRSTTVATLRQNLETILALYSSSSARLLGMPHFTFSFESAWKERPTRALSQQTYVDWDVRMKSPAMGGAVFDEGLEPLMEIFRLLAYEWSKKVVLLNLARDSASLEEKAAIEAWFQGLGAFCARTMLGFLNDFARGSLGFAALATGRDRLFRSVADYYRILPPHLREPVTLEAHASAFSYGQHVDLVEVDEYWAKQIPEPIPRTAPHGLRTGLGS